MNYKKSIVISLLLILMTTGLVSHSLSNETLRTSGSSPMTGVVLDGMITEFFLR